MDSKKYRPKHGRSSDRPALFGHRPKRSAAAVAAGLLLALTVTIAPASAGPRSFADIFAGLFQRMGLLSVLASPAPSDSGGEPPEPTSQETPDSEGTPEEGEDPAPEEEASPDPTPVPSPSPSPSVTPPAGTGPLPANEARRTTKERINELLKSLKNRPDPAAVKIDAKAMTQRILDRVADRLSPGRTETPAPTCAEPFGEGPSQLTVINHHGPALEVSWVGFDCKEVLFATVKPGEEFSVSTFIGHRWKIRTVRHEKYGQQLLSDFFVRDASHTQVFGDPDYVPPPPPPPPGDMESEFPAAL